MIQNAETRVILTALQQQKAILKGMGSGHCGEDENIVKILFSTKLKEVLWALTWSLVIS